MCVAAYDDHNFGYFTLFSAVLWPIQGFSRCHQCAEADRKTCQVLIIEDDQDDAFLLKRALNAAALETGVALGDDA